MGGLGQGNQRSGRNLPGVELDHPRRVLRRYQAAFGCRTGNLRPEDPAQPESLSPSLVDCLRQLIPPSSKSIANLATAIFPVAVLP